MMHRFTSRRGTRTLRLGMALLAMGMAGAVGSGRVAAQAPQTDLALTIDQRTQSPIVTGATVKYDIEISNPTLANAPTTIVRITMPQGLSNITATPQTGSGFSCSVSGLTIDCTAATVPAGANREIRVEARTPAKIVGDSQTFAITAQIDPFDTIREVSEKNNVSTVLTVVETRPDLDPDLSTVPLLVSEGREITYPVIVRNAGNRVAAGVVVRATLPEDVSFVRFERGDFAACERSGRNITCAGAVIPVGSAGAFRVVASVPSSLGDDSILFEVAVDPNNAILERSETNNTAFALTTVVGRPDLTVSASSDGWSPPVVFGGPFELPKVPVHGTSLFITVNNIGGGDAPATKVRFDLDGALQERVLCNDGLRMEEGSCVLAPLGSAASCSQSGRTVTCDVPAVPAGSSRTIQVDATREYFGFGYSFSTTVSVDPDRTVTERSELNNNTTVSVEVG